MESSGYPSIFLFAILAISLPLAFFNPFRAFILMVLIISSVDNYSFTMTRTEILGPYLNGHDTCLLISIIAFLFYMVRSGKTIAFPLITKWLIFILFVGYVQTGVSFGWSYEALRALRWALTLPIYMVIASHMMDEESKVNTFIMTLFYGAIVSSIQHILFVRESINFFQVSTEQIHFFRTIAYRNAGIWLLLSGIYWYPKRKLIQKGILFLGGIFFTLSILLNQTRSVWISSILVYPLTFFYFRQNISKKLIYFPVMLMVVFGGVLIMVNYVHSEISIENIIVQRFTTFSDENLRFMTTVTRQLSLERELEEWGKGTFILGRGLFYFSNFFWDLYKGHRVAWGHLGHVTTLAQLGLVGLFIYSIYLPSVIVNRGRRLWFAHREEVKFLGLIGGLTMLWCWICFFMSDSFLGQDALRGIIFGAVYGIEKSMKPDSTETPLVG